MSPTQRTLAYLRRNGYEVAITEHWNQWARRRIDLFGIIDIVALHPGGYTFGIQCTSASNVSSRVKKMLASPITKRLVACGWELRVIGWKKGEKEPIVREIR